MLVFITGGSMAQILVGLIVRPPSRVSSSPAAPFLAPDALFLTPPSGRPLRPRVGLILGPPGPLAIRPRKNHLEAGVYVRPEYIICNSKWPFNVLRPL